MSFPPRPPIGMPSMAPGMGYAFAPMGMMQMGMGMMPPTTVIRPIVTATQNSTSAVAKPNKKQLVPQEIPKDDKEEKPPVTTVFVGNISERAPDAMVRQMLQRCGNVLSWKRVQGASGKLQAFGFCEYEDPEATLRCMRLLNEWEIADKKLVVKVDAKTKTLLDEYRNKKKAKQSGKSDEASKDKDKEKDTKENGEIDETVEKEEKEEDSNDDELDEFTKREDRVAKAGLDAIMREYAGDLAKTPVSEMEKEQKPVKKKVEEEKIIKDTGIDDIDMEEDKREIINREIKSFRDLHKGEDEVEKDQEKERERERERIRIVEEKRRRDRERAKEREREREKEREMEKYDRERERERLRSRTRSRSRSPARRRRERSRSRERRKDRDRDAEDEEEAYERRKLEKKLREKEEEYQKRLKNWEARERKKAREYEKEKEREEERKSEEAREARRLKEFLEDYDDERDDPKYYKGSNLIRRLKEREKEREADARDRQREKEELEEIKRNLLEEGHPDPEAELAKIEREREEHLKPRLHLNEHSTSSSPKEVKPESDDEEDDEGDKPVLPPNMKPTLRPIETSNDASPTSEDNDSNFPPPSEDSQQPIYGPSPKVENTKLGFSGLKLGAGSPSDGGSAKRKKLTVGDVFNQDDDDSSDGAKRRKLVPLDYDDDKSDGKKPTTAEEKRLRIKKLIESIPTAKEELFAYHLDWNIVDQALMDKRIKPWVNKKIIEYIGEEEPTLTDFICQKVMVRSGPQNILNDVAMVLDEEAEVFVVKMWRLLVYETEAKKLGLVK